MSESKGHYLEPSEAKGCKAEAKAGDDEELVKSVITFFFNDDDLSQTFARFAEDHCHVFDVESDEMKLIYTPLYEEFQALFEEKLEQYIRSIGYTSQDFLNAVKKAYQDDRESSIALCSEILVATADFDVFVLMMKQTKEALGDSKSM